MTLWILISLMGLVIAAGAATGLIYTRRGGSRLLSPAGWRERWRDDARELQRASAELDEVLADLCGLIHESDRDPLVVPAPEERERARAAWMKAADLGVALYLRARFHRDFILMWSFHPRRRDRIRGFLFCDAVDLVLQDAALVLTDAVAANPKWEALLNEPHAGLGLPEGAFAALRDRAHNPERAARQYTAKGYLGFLRTLKAFVITDKDPDAKWLLQTCDRLHAKTEQRFRADGHRLAARQIGIYGRALFLAAWFPLQKNVAGAMGKVRLRRGGWFLVSPDRARRLRARLQPGDIGLTRKSWFLSNAGIPGFWPHAVLHVGTAEELETFFDDDDMRAWVKQRDPEANSFIAYLQRTYPGAWARFTALPKPGMSPMSFIESTAPGVLFHPVEETLAVDFTAFMRPRLEKAQIAEAISRAFSYESRPYDFDFDFRRDHCLVCSELVYKSYQGGESGQGLDLPLELTLGRPLLAPTRIARMYAEQRESPDRQLDFVLFSDASESRLQSFDGTEADFCHSWKRPKYYAFVS